MYVALRPFKNQLPSGQVMALYPGDEVVGFSSWPIINQTAAINAQLVRLADPSHNHDIETLIGTTAGESGPTRRVQANAVLAAAVARTAAPAAEPTRSEVASDFAPEQVADPTPADEMPGANKCVQCDFVARTPHALKIHVGRSHKAEP